MDQQSVKFEVVITEAAVEQTPRAKRKTKQKRMTKDIVKKRRQVNILEKNLEHCIRKIERKCDEKKKISRSKTSAETPIYTIEYY